MNFAKLKKITATIPVKWNGQTVKVEFYTFFMTPKFLDDLAQAKEKGAKEFYQVLAPVITNWDLTWKGKTFPPTFTNMQKVPLDFLNLIYEEMKKFKAFKFKSGELQWLN